jgi:tetratricopeptide (TPR) repeat protein
LDLRLECLWLFPSETLGWLDWSKMIIASFPFRPLQLCTLIWVLAAIGQTSLSAGQLTLPSEATLAMDKIYSGNPQAAIIILRSLQTTQPENPIGFLLEGEATWWLIYCDNAEVKYGIMDAWKRGKKPEDEAYFDLADKVISLSQAQIAKSDTAEMHLYVASGYALKARLYALRGENRAVAHAGVAARSEYLSALQLDPQMADATAGLGLYNYYVDSLPSVVKVLRFFMGIPGGDRVEGIRQMQVGIDHGVLSHVEMRFYLAKNLRNFDREYEKALVVAEPLVVAYPQNPIFQLLLGNLNAELGRTGKAAQYFHSAVQVSSNHENCPTCSTCNTHVREMADTFLAAQH